MFQLKEETPTHYTIKHPSGDVLKIAKKGLSPELHSTIKKMFGGGVATEDDDSSDSDTQPQAPVVVNVGTGPQPQQNPVGPQQMQIGPQQQEGTNSPQMANPIPTLPGYGEKQRYQNAEAKKPTGPQNFMLPTPTAAGGGMDMSQVPDLAAQMQHNLGVEQGAYQQIGKAQSVAAKGQAETAQKEMEDLNNLTTLHQQEHATLMGEQQKVAKEIMNGTVDFNRVWHNKSAGQKVMASIGMILSGMGAGLAHQQNLAVDLINKEIERDVQSQMANQENKKTVFGMYNQMLGNSDHAYQMAVLGLKGATAAKMQKLAYESNSPIAIAQANLLGSQAAQGIQSQISQISWQRAIQKSLTQPGANGQPNVDPQTQIRLSNYMGATPEQQKQMSEDYTKLSKMKTAGENLIKAFDESANLRGGGFFSPNERNQIIQPAIRNYLAASGQRVTEENVKMMEKGFREKLGIFHPGEVFGEDKEHTKKLRSALIDSLQQGMKSSVLDQYRIPKPEIIAPTAAE